MNRIAKISGLAYLMIFLTGFYANFYAVDSLIDFSNINKTIENLNNNTSQLGYGILGFIFMLFFDVLLVWALYVFLKKVNRKVSLIASSLRLINAIIFGIALYNLIKVYQTFENPNINIQPFEMQQQIISSLETFNQVWTVGLIIFGVHLTFLGYLIFKSNFIPNSLGLLLFIATLGYLIDGTANLFMPNYTDYKDVFAVVVIMPAVIGEFSFTIWLLVKGFKKQPFLN